MCEARNFLKCLYGDQVWKAQFVLELNPPEVELWFRSIEHIGKDGLHGTVTHGQVRRHAPQGVEAFNVGAPTHELQLRRCWIGAN